MIPTSVTATSLRATVTSVQSRITATLVTIHGGHFICGGHFERLAKLAARTKIITADLEHPRKDLQAISEHTVASILWQVAKTQLGSKAVFKHFYVILEILIKMGGSVESIWLIF